MPVITGKPWAVVRFSPDGTQLACLNWAVINVYNTSDWSLITSITNNGDYYALEYSSDGSLLVTDGTNYDEMRLIMFDTTTWEQVLGVDFYYATQIAVQPTGNYLAVAGYESEESTGETLKLFSVSGWQYYSNFGTKSCVGGFTALAFSRDGSLLCYGTEVDGEDGGTLFVANVEDGVEVFAPQDIVVPITGISFSDNLLGVVTGSATKRAYQISDWSTVPMAVIGSYDENCTFSHDGVRLALANELYALCVLAVKCCT